MPAENTTMYSESARARTQAGTAVCAAICSEDSTAIHAKPASSATAYSRWIQRSSATPSVHPA